MLSTSLFLLSLMISFEQFFKIDIFSFKTEHESLNMDAAFVLVHDDCCESKRFEDVDF